LGISFPFSWANYTVIAGGDIVDDDGAVVNGCACVM